MLDLPPHYIYSTPLCLPVLFFPFSFFFAFTFLIDRSIHFTPQPIVMLPNDVPSPPCSPSRLVHAMEDREGIVAKQCWDGASTNEKDHLLHSQPPSPIAAINLVSASRSTPRPLNRQRSFVGLRPFPAKTPSMTLIRHRSTSCLKKTASDVHLLPRLEKENANLPPQVCTYAVTCIHGTSTIS